MIKYLKNNDNKFITNLESILNENNWFKQFEYERLPGENEPKKIGYHWQKNAYNYCHYIKIENNYLKIRLSKLRKSDGLYVPYYLKDICIDNLDEITFNRKGIDSIKIK